jgi:hypothetical protein
MDHARRVPAIEGLQTPADPGAAARALRHDREPIECARGILLLHRVGDVGKPGVEQEGLGLAKFVDHTVDEAQEHSRIHAHRAGGVEQHDEPQRPVLALSFDQRDRHAAMADVAVDGPSQIEPVALPAREITPGQPRAHRLGKLGCRRMGLFDLVRVGQFAEIGLGKIISARGALHAALAARALRRIVAGRLDLVGRGGLAAPLGFVLQAFQRRAVGRLRRADGRGARAHAFSEPERIEQAVEFLPVGFP